MATVIRLRSRTGRPGRDQNMPNANWVTSGKKSGASSAAGRPPAAADLLAPQLGLDRSALREPVVGGLGCHGCSSSGGVGWGWGWLGVGLVGGGVGRLGSGSSDGHAKAETTATSPGAVDYRVPNVAAVACSRFLLFDPFACPGGVPAHRSH